MVVLAPPRRHYTDTDTGQALTEEEVDRYQLNPLWFPYVREQEVLAAAS